MHHTNRLVGQCHLSIAPVKDAEDEVDTPEEWVHSPHQLVGVALLTVSPRCRGRHTRPPQEGLRSSWIDDVVDGFDPRRGQSPRAITGAEADMADWTELILDPTLGHKTDVDTRLAPRRPLEGAVVALLDNGKANGGPMLELIAEELTRRCGVRGVRTFTKDDAGTTLDPAILDEVLAGCTAAITAIGDCGSCSAATVADAILLERAGVPAVAVCTEPFRLSGDAMAESYGFPGFDYVRVPHPVASLDRAGVDARVAGVLTHVLAILGVGR